MGLEFHECNINKSAHTKKVCKLIVCTSYIYIYIYICVCDVCVCVCGTMWVGRQSRRFLCLFWCETKGFLDMKSRRIRKWEGDANESWLEKELRGSWRLDGRATGQQRVGGGTAKRVGVEPRTGAVNTGLRRQEETR